MTSRERHVPNKSILVACAAFVIAACATPAPEIATPTPTSIGLPATSTPSPPTPTPSPTPEPTATPVPRLEIILERGNLICGIDPERPELAGFESDYCHAVAAALFDNPDAVEIRPLNREEAEAALRAGEIDVYLGSLDSLRPDVTEGQILFYEAAGAMTRNDVGISQIADMKYATICLIQDSIDERVFGEAATAARVTYQPLLFNAGDYDGMYKAYDEGRCDVVVDDRVRLAQRLPTLSVPRDHELIDITLITGQRGPIVWAGDSSWPGVNLVIGSAIIQAEELDIASGNLDAAMSSDRDAIRRLLGLEGSVWADLGLTQDVLVRILTHVGNYGEMYSRNFPDLPRGPNALAKDGGRIAAVP